MPRVLVEKYYVAHVEMQFIRRDIDVEKVLSEAKARCIKSLVRNLRTNFCLE